VRVGIATGLVVVGDLVGDEAVDEDTVVGEAPNLAARLQGLATPNAVVISARTRHLLGGLFDCADLGVHQLKSFDEPVQAWQVLRPSAAESRFAARQAAGLTPLVGREHEIALLLDRWQQAKEGERQVVLMGGEPAVPAHSRQGQGAGSARSADLRRDRAMVPGRLQLRFAVTP
jgi:Adenylate and Guanylate cyclase catalytic domain